MCYKINYPWGDITDPLYLPLKRGGPVCQPLECTICYPMSRRKDPWNLWENKIYSWENISSLKESKKFGGVRGKIYLCIRLAASQQLKRASLRSTCTIFA